MENMIKFSLRNKLAIWILTVIAIFAGLFSGFNMKLETIPDINTPIISVTTTYPGATPEEVQEKVTVPIEEAVRNLNGVEIVSSNSFENASSIQIEYKFEKDMERAEEEVEKALKQVELPDGVGEPKIARFSINAFPVYTVSFFDEGKTLPELTELVEKIIVPELKGIDGVESIVTSGQQVEEGRIVFHQDKLKELGLNEETIKNYIQGADLRAPLGLYTFKDTEKSVVVDGNITTIEDLKKLKIPVTGASQGEQAGGAQMNQMPNGLSGANGAAPNQALSQKNMELPTVELGEIADIEIVGKAESISRTNGKEAIGLQIVKATDANTVEVVNEVKEKLDELKDEYKGLGIVSTLDQAEPIEKSVATMLNKALFGSIFAVAVILLFLRNIRSTLISVVSIPLSILIALIVLHEMDITLNMMTLGAMTMAIGRVIDDSIVVIENIYRRMTLKGEQLKGKELIIAATKEMFIPIMSSTIVTIAVFLPLAFVEGMVGQLFMPFALTIVFSLLASLLVAITIVPALAHVLFRKGAKQKEKEKEAGFLATYYKKILNWCLNHKWITSLIAILLLVSSLFLIPVIGVSFLPSEQEKQMIVTYNPDPGQTLEEVKDVALQAEDLLVDRDHVKTVQLSVGSENPMNPGNRNQAIFFIMYEDDTPNFEQEKEKVVKDLSKLTHEKGDWGTIDMMASSNEYTLYVFGDSMEEIEPVAQKVQNILEDESNLKNVESSLSKTYDEYTLVVDQEKMSKLGLTAGQIAMALSQQHERPVLTTIQKDGQDIKVYIEGEEETFASIDEMKKKTIQSPLGMNVQIGEVATVKEGETSNTITRRGGKFTVSVSGEITANDVSQVNESIQKKIDDLKLPPGVNIETGGVTEQINESFSQLGLAMLAAIAVVYFVLVVTFSQGLAPFAILFSLPFTVIGGFVALWLGGETLSVSALIGALMLIGIVVTNAIVLIDRVIHKEREGLSTRDALIEAGATRLRPILMTALATVGALLPLALGYEGDGGMISRGLGLTVIGGLTSSTLLTLIIVPIVYEVLSKFRRKTTVEE
ncbi:efflux RND transporter permease subunit [Anoxybacillus sp. P3H1B]|uniref:efflux RND transporter permease subunit n=1 Tax=Anoxybacillus sp. P3H1B TaxID=1769293 RepID=UPI0012E3774B|nr:efflux RND transporter permease subunit [Anoxybacillus sp. P3H1B]